MLDKINNQNIINYINTQAESIKESDLDWVADETVNHFDKKLNKLAYKAYGVSENISILSFKQQSKEEIKKAIYTYIFTSKHYLSGRDISSYLITTLNRLADRVKWDKDSSKCINVPVCPGCKYFGNREYLICEDKLLRCNNCTNQLIKLNEEIEKTKKNDKLSISYINTNNISIYKAFSLHSKRGYRCPDCKKFIPQSLSQDGLNISCPYSNCFFFGEISSLDMMAHPLGLSIRNDVSLSSPISNNKSDFAGKDSEKLENLIKSSSINVDDEIAIKQDYIKEYNILYEVIKTQMERVKIKNSSTKIQKTLMYEAYIKMLNKYPEEMISYLVHLKQCSEFPIQAKIFQEYVKLIEDAMPLTIVKSGESIDILSLTDPNLCLFTGISKFNARVDKNNNIPNNTIETYTGGRKMKYRGSCFIGKIIDIKDNKTGISIKNSMKQHSFVEIEMNKEIEPNTDVEVTHFRILPHYEIGSLVYLQRIRRKIVDSVYFRINNKKREITRGQKNNEEQNI